MQKKSHKKLLHLQIITLHLHKLMLLLWLKENEDL